PEIKSEKDTMSWLREGNEEWVPSYFKRFVGKYLNTGVHESNALRSRYAGAGSFLTRLRSGYSAYQDLDKLAFELVERIERGTSDAKESSRGPEETSPVESQAEVVR
ncbi:MAG: hypothetical protein ACLPIX_21200, partial [Rhodomicrobium sp.]